VTNAGVIPDQFDYDVVLLPEEHRVGTLNEDFAFESLAGDVFQLGNASYRIVKIETGKVMVEDARGQPPSMPFWLGESLGRTDELSHAVSRLSAQADAQLDDGVAACEHWCATSNGCPPLRRSNSRCTSARRRPRWAGCRPRTASCSSASSTRSATATW
jgi:ATP-dependent Lhr-like helicase